jgi:hypothetical protein
LRNSVRAALAITHPDVAPQMVKMAGRAFFVAYGLVLISYAMMAELRRNGVKMEGIRGAYVSTS